MGLKQKKKKNEKRQKDSIKLLLKQSDAISENKALGD